MCQELAPWRLLLRGHSHQCSIFTRAGDLLVRPPHCRDQLPSPTAGLMFMTGWENRVRDPRMTRRGEDSLHRGNIMGVALEFCHLRKSLRSKDQGESA